LKWQYRSGELDDLVGFPVHSKEALSLQISKITVVNDLFSLSLLWAFDLNKSSQHLPGIVYEIIVRYFFSTDKYIGFDLPKTIINHSLQVAFHEFNKRKIETLFRSHDLKVHTNKEVLLSYLINYLLKASKVAW
jgi:hypothetical protein